MQLRDHIAIRVWKILYPFLFYYAVVLITQVIAQWAVGNEPSRYVIARFAATIITIPCMLPFYQQDLGLRGIDGRLFRNLLIQEEHLDRTTQKRLLDGAAAVMIALLIGTGVNNLITMSPLLPVSAGYAEANRYFYGSTLWWELACSALTVPVLEELVFRGILYGRLKDMVPRWIALLGSAALFAVMHMNLVQFVYAFCMGIVLALLLEQFGGLYASILGHMAVNALAVCRTELGWLRFTADGSVAAWVISIVCLLVGNMLVILLNRRG